MKKVLTRLSRFAALALATTLAALGARADIEKTNPVTGQSESYSNSFTGGTGGTAVEWNDAANWDTATTPFIANTYTPSLVSGKTASTSTQVDGWTLRVGAYDGATVTWSGGVKKIQAGSAGCWLTADANSTIAIASFAGLQLEGSNAYPLKLTSANAGGITWNCDLSATSTASDKLIPFHYYIDAINNGSVVYTGNITVANDQVIKQVNIKLTGNSQISNKTLVTFGSDTTKTFTADAAIKVYGTDGTTLVETVNLAEVKTASTLTASDPVGSCELVQTSTGIVLYYVDGNPSAVVAKTYTPSININFCHGNAPLTTAADVGCGNYAVPGTSWNNMVSAGGNNGTFTTPLSTIYGIDSTGAPKAISGASVAVSGTRGSWSCPNLAAASDLRNGYVDESSSGTTPTVTVSGIPYDQYKVVVYTATDAANVAFGYVTINGTNYTYSEGAVAEGTAAWGASGAQNTANALAEGVNVLVSPVVSGATLTVVGHRSGDNPRGCIAAVQIVKVEQQVGENDLLIELDGDRTYTFDEAKAYSGTVYVTGSGTLTFAGAASTAATLHIGPAAAVNMVGSALTPTAVTGNGTAIYDGTNPATGKGWTDSSNWTGVLWVKNCSSFTSVLPDTMVNANSTLRLTDCSGWFNNGDNAQTCDGTLELVDGNSAAFTVSDGYSSNGMTTFAKLIGDGTLTHSKGAVHQRYVFTDPSGFKGTINIPAGTETYGTGNNRPLRVILGNYSQLASAPSQGSITIAPGATATVASGKTWTAAGGGIAVYGTLNVNGTLAVSSSATAAVSGSGTVVFTGRAPTPVDGENETKWWKNANWTGTVQIASVNNMTGNDTGTKIAFNDYGNDNSIVELNNVTGWLPNNYTCTPKLKITGTLSLNNGSSGPENAFKVGTLLGSGTISGSSSAPTAVLNVTGDSSGFTGTIGLNDSKCIVFGSTIPDTLARGTIYISEGAVAEIKTTTGNWWATGGIVVNGTLKVTDRDRWGGGTAMTLGDNGVLELTSAANTEDYKDYSSVTGTGTIKYSSTAGWRTFPVDDAKAPSTTLTIQVELADSLIITRDAGRETVIGNLAGSKNIRSDWNPSGSGSANNARTLTVTQSKDTEWQGKFVSNRITQFNVNRGASTTGTLTLSGTQTETVPAAINGSVNLTGTWVGATTVSGTFGGTGTLTGNLTLSAGATFKAFASDADGLAVSGTVTTPGSGTVTVDVSAISESITASGVTLISGGVSEVGTFAVDSAYRLAVDGSALKVYPAVTYVAEYNGVQYETVQEAIDAAELAGGTYADVTIRDATAECPAGYYVDTENSNALTKYQAAIVKTDSSKVYFKTPQLAFDDIAANANLITYMQQGYTCVEVYYGTDVAISINASATIWMGHPVKIRCLDSATVSVTTTATESTLTAGAADENGIVTYTKADIATTYVWAGGTTLKPWSNPNNWKVGTLEGVTATRKPGALDTVQIGDGAKVTDIVGSLNVAALQVSGTVTFTGGGTLTSDSAITLGANDSIVITGTLSPVPTTSVADSYVKATTSDGTTTYAVDAYNTVTFTGATAKRTDNLGSAIKDGDTITFTLDAGEGYAVDTVTPTSGEVTESNGVYSYTVTENATITVTTVSAAVAFSEVEFDYYVGYGSAKSVTAKVTGVVAEGTAWTLTVGGTEYAGGVYDSATGKVTWTPENGIAKNLAAGQALSYSIAATGGSTGTLANQQTTVGNVVDGWIAEDATHSGTGTWSPNAPVFGEDDRAALSGETTFTARAQASGKVTLTTVVNFGNDADPTIEIDADAKAAIKVENNSFKIWTKTTSEGGTGATADWLTVSGATPDLSADSRVVVTFDTDAKTFTVSVDGAALYYGESNANASFAFASDGIAIGSIQYKGTGSFISLTGEYTTTDIAQTVDGKGVVVANSFISGNAALRAMTIEEATAALAPNSTATCGNGLNYFANYALGLDPTKADDKPIVDVTTDANGNYVFTVKHPVYDAQGVITSYEEINAADNVTATVTLKYGTDANAQSWESAEGTSVAPNALPFGENNNVLYYKADVTIGAK